MSWKDSAKRHKEDVRAVLEVLNVRESTIQFVERRIESAAMEASHDAQNETLQKILPYKDGSI